MNRFKEDISWTPREVRPVGEETPPDQRESSAPEGGEVPASGLIPPEDRELVEESLEAAREEVDRLEQEALDYLNENLSVPTDSRPVTEEAVEYIAGTHPDFGNRRPEVPEDEQLDTGGEVTGEVFDRAYATIENADRNMLGFDVKDAVLGDDPGQTRPHTSIDTPGQAAGRRDTRRGDKKSVTKVQEERMQTERKSMFEIAFEKVVGFLLRLAGRVFNSVGQAFESALTLSVGPATLNLGKYLAMPFYWLRDLLWDLAEDYMNLALGNRYETPSPDPPGETEVGDGRDGSARSDPRNAARSISRDGQPRSDRPNVAGDNHSGRRFVESAQQVLRATGEHVRETNDSGLARAIDRYEKARTLRNELDAHDDIAAAWGADRPSDASVPMPADAAEEDIIESEQLPFVCPAPR